MQSGVYRKIEGRTGVGQFYQFLHLARHHTTGHQYVVYIPLRVEADWAGTVRPCILERALFEQKFEYVGEGLPASAACMNGHVWSNDFGDDWHPDPGMRCDCGERLWGGGSDVVQTVR